MGENICSLQTGHQQPITEMTLSNMLWWNSEYSWTMAKHTLGNLHVWMYLKVAASLKSLPQGDYSQICIPLLSVHPIVVNCASDNLNTIDCYCFYKLGTTWAFCIIIIIILISELRKLCIPKSFEKIRSIWEYFIHRKKLHFTTSLHYCL